MRIRSRDRDSYTFLMAVSGSRRNSDGFYPGDVITELRTYTSRDAVHAGETFKAAVRLMIGPEWHINANPASNEYLIPTSLEFAPGPLPFHVLDIVYPEALMVRLGFSESDVAVYSESVLIGALVEATLP